MPRPLAANPEPGEQYERVRRLVAVSEADPLAPFALRPDKQFVFSADGRTALGYKIILRTAVASGDPVGDPAGFGETIDSFVALARARRLRIAVLGAGERTLERWRSHGLAAVPFGRDVVIHRDRWSLSGRPMRNVRQAIQRAANAGVTAQIRREGQLRPTELLELRGLMQRTRKHDERGFSMILGRMFDGTQPEAVVAMAYAADGTLIGAHRYLWAGTKDLSLDLPIRHDEAPNGVDEYLVEALLGWSADAGVDRVSLAFAPFPELFEDRAALGPFGRLAARLVHLLDPLIQVEGLYRYLRKFRAFDQRRYLLLRWRSIVPTVLACLLLEFSR